MSQIPDHSGEPCPPQPKSAAAQERGAEIVAADSGRLTCYRCFRPLAHCYCGDIPQVTNTTRIVIVQHPRERFHPIGTARIAELGLTNSTVLINSNRRYSHEQLPLPANAGLLFPDAMARDLSSLAPDERPEALVVLDGTWHHAHTLFRDIPALEALPRYRFTPPRPSQYRLRREPQRDYVSTIEAIVYALQALGEDPQELEKLLGAFHAMIDRQERAQVSERVGRVRKKRRPHSVSRLPRAFAEEYGRAVVVYGEGMRIKRADCRARVQLVHWVAKRLHDGKTFDCVLQPGVASAETALPLMGLGPDDAATALSAEQFQEAWNQFIDQDDILIGWNQSTLALLEAYSLWHGDRIYLKAAYHSVRPRNTAEGGSPEDLVRQEGLQRAVSTLRGRAGLRLANAETLCAYLAALAV